MALSDNYLKAALSRLIDAQLTRVVAVPTPAAGAEWSITVPAGEIWSIQSVIATLTTDATVATRDPKITHDDGTTIYSRTVARNGVAASLTSQLSWFAGAGSFAADVATTAMVGAIFAGPLRPGHRLRSVTTAMVAGDAYTAVRLVVGLLSPSDIAQQAAEIERELRATFGLGVGIE